MALKSYRLRQFIKKGKKKKKSIEKLLVSGATAIVGIALFSETAKAVSRV